MTDELVPSDQPTEPQAEARDPFAVALEAVLNRLKLKQLALAQEIAVSRSSLNRLINLERDAASINLGHVRKIFTKLAPELEKEKQEEVWEYVQAHHHLPQRWEEYLAQRGVAVFYELAAALVNQKTRTEINPVAWVVTLAEEGIWQLASQPHERWLITDVLAELEFSILLERTSQVIDHSDFRRLVILRPGHTGREFHDFRNAASARCFDEKVLWIEIPDREFFMRMRIDEPCSLTGGASGVMGAAGAPLLFRVPPELIASIRRRWARVVNYFDTHPNEKDYKGCRRRFPTDTTEGVS